MILFQDEDFKVKVEDFVLFVHLVIRRQNQVVSDLDHVIVIIYVSIDKGVIARLQSINKRLKLDGLFKYGLL